MTIFLHGSDSYRRTQRLIEALRQFVTKYPNSGIRRYDAESDDKVPEQVNELFSSSSLFSPRTLAVVTNALELTPAQLKPLIARAGAGESHHLILVADTDKPAKTYARLTEDDVKAEAFPKLSGEAWATFVTREAQARGLSIARTSFAKLSNAFLGNSWGLVTELDVLAAMPEELRTERLAEIMRAVPAGAPNWSDLRRLGSGDPAQRLALLARFEATGDPAAKTFSMAAYGANPTVVADADIGVKTGGWEFEEALLALALY